MKLLLYVVFLRTVCAIPDITTIYRLDKDDIIKRKESEFTTLPASVDVHARNDNDNIFLLRDGFAKGPNVDVLFEECIAESGGCKNWNMTGWKVKRTSRGDIYSLPLGTYEHEDTLSNSISPMRNFVDNLEVNVVPHISSMVTNINLVNFSLTMMASDQEALEKRIHSVILFFDIRILENSERIVFNCSKENKNENLTDNCEIVHQTEFQFPSSELNTLQVKLEEEDETVNRLIVTVPGIDDFILTLPDNYRITNYETQLMGTSGMVKSKGIGQQIQLLHPKDENGNLTSKHEIFVSNETEICVQVVCYLTEKGSISVKVKLSSGKEHNLTRTNYQKPGWGKYKYFLPAGTLSDEMVRIMVIVENPDYSEDLFIQRISSCSKEVTKEQILALDKKEYALPLPKGFTVLHESEKQAWKWSSKEARTPHHECLNGGVWDTSNQECSCPAGFIGTQCEQGCGPNRYGNDCGGLCSDTTEGCKWMYLCRPNQPCECGPGFQGKFCNKSCQDGYYGAGCKQPCGECAVDTCDIYTGTCHHGCQEGYTLPLCIYKYNYLKNKPVVQSERGVSVEVFADFSQLGGDPSFNPAFYQLQYRPPSMSWKSGKRKRFPGSDPKYSIEELSTLDPGRTYELRVILFDKDSGSYQGDKVPITSFETWCKVPDQVAYNMNVKARPDGLEVTWDYTTFDKSKELCTVTTYEIHVKLTWKWTVHIVNTLNMTTSILEINNLLHGRKYYVKMRGVTKASPLSFSPTEKVQVGIEAPLTHIRNLRATVKADGVVEIFWLPPHDDHISIVSYHVSFECVRLMACQDDQRTCNHTLNKNTNGINIVIKTEDGLKPFARYNVSVWAMDGYGNAGPGQSIQIVTEPVKTDLTVGGIFLKSDDTSVTVFWPPLDKDCDQLNGSIIEYESIICEDYWSGNNQTKNTIVPEVTFKNLKPNTDYKVTVKVITAAGESNKEQSVTMKTKLAAPEAVENLIVYKTSETSIGIRWEKPHDSDIKTFTVKYAEADSMFSLMTKEQTSYVRHFKCPAWPDKFCHTIQNSGYTYIDVQVSARNYDVPKDGKLSSLKRLEFKNQEPGYATDLEVNFKHSTTYEVCWQYPDPPKTNLSHFVVYVSSKRDTKIQQVDAKEQSSFCAEIHDLKPKTEYTVTVVAHNVASAGPKVSKTFETKEK